MSSEQLMSLREHLSELKRRFKIAFIVFVAVLVIFLIFPANPYWILTFNYYTFTPIIAIFISRIKLDLLPPGWGLIAYHLNEPLEIYIVAALLLATIFNGPLFAYEVIRFVGPGLNEREKRLIYPFVGSAAGLFAFGVAFGYVFLAKFLLLALAPFFNIVGVNPILIDAADFYFVVLLTIGMAGVAFTVPVYVYTLIDFGVIQATSFRKNRLIIWAGVYILTAIITPDGGPLLDIILFIPIITLLELAVFLGGRARARHLREEAAKAGASPPTAPSPPTPPPVTPGPPPPPVAPSSTSTIIDTRRLCMYCQHELPPGKVFCSNCGRSNE